MAVENHCIAEWCAIAIGKLLSIMQPAMNVLLPRVQSMMSNQQCSFSVPGLQSAIVWAWRNADTHFVFCFHSLCLSGYLLIMYCVTGLENGKHIYSSCILTSINSCLTVQNALTDKNVPCDMISSQLSVKNGGTHK